MRRNPGAVELPSGQRAATADGHDRPTHLPGRGSDADGGLAAERTGDLFRG
jgi:hypothetical protein